MIPAATIAAYASQAVGTQITLSCDADATFPQGLDGYVLPNPDGSIPHTIHVRQSLCAAAENVDRNQVRPAGWYFLWADHRADAVAGSALDVILHESMHVALQSTDETQVECTTFQNRWAFLKQFRLPAWIASLELAGMGWHASHLPAQYHTRPC